MSLKQKRWNIQHPSRPADIRATLLKNRKIAEADWELFFHGTYTEHGYSPFLMEDMERAVERIFQAIDSKERVVVFGDYDVDGTTGTTILVRALEEYGAQVSYRIPHRLEDGYGLKNYFIEELKEKEVSLIITTDNGISSVGEITLANELGMDVIVTDHHEPPDPLPPAYAILNPRLEGCAYPNKVLSGSMVAFKLVEALLARRSSPEVEAIRDDLFAIGTIGLVADCMPLSGENRIITKAGLEILKKTTHPGLRELYVQANIQPEGITAGTIGFRIGPRINASGRMESAYNALHLLIKDRAVAQVKAPLLERLNNNRRQAVEQGVQEAIAMVGSNPTDTLIMVASPNWNPGINGLIASGLQERFARPVIVHSIKNGVVTASARSISAFNIIEHIRKFASYLGHYGGHPQAAGYNLKEENYKAFSKAMIREANTILTPEQLKHTLHIEAPLQMEDLTWETLATINDFAPFGIGNPTPIFTLPRVHQYRAEKLGKTHAHLKLYITHRGESIEAIAFGMGEYEAQLRTSPPISLAFELQENTWNGQSKLQLMIKDINILPH